MNSISRRAVLAAVLGIACATGAQAATVNLTGADLNQWQTFDVDDFAAPGGGLGWIDVNTNTLLNFSITLGAPAYLRVVDSGFAGDVFSVTRNGNPLGVTSAATDTFALGLARGTTQADFDAAFADDRFSRGSFLLGAGTHDISGLLRSTTAPFNATVGALQLAPVPEPGGWALLLAGLGLIGAIARRGGRTSSEFPFHRPSVEA